MPLLKNIISSWQFAVGNEEYAVANCKLRTAYCQLQTANYVARSADGRDRDGEVLLSRTLRHTGRPGDRRGRAGEGSGRAAA